MHTSATAEDLAFSDLATHAPWSRTTGALATWHKLQKRCFLFTSLDDTHFAHWF
jgi:hypothetical protein